MIWLSCSFSNFLMSMCSHFLNKVYDDIALYFYINYFFLPKMVIKILKNLREFDVIQVLCKPSSIFQCFDWYISHSQGEDVEWKIYITVQHFTPVKLKKITCCKVKSMNKIPFIWWNNIYVISKGYNQINQWL